MKSKKSTILWIICIITPLALFFLYHGVRNLYVSYELGKIEKEWRASAESVMTYMPEMLKSEFITDAKVNVKQGIIRQKGRLDEYCDDMSVRLYAKSEFNTLPIEERYVIMRDAFHAARYDAYEEILDTYHPGLWKAFQNDLDFDGEDNGFQSIIIKLDLDTSDGQHYELKILFDDKLFGMIDNHGMKWTNNTGSKSEIILPEEIEVYSEYRLGWEQELMKNDNVSVELRNRYINEGNQWRAARKAAREKEAGSKSNTYYSPPVSSSSKSKGSNLNSYDEGYEDAYENDDYDWDRYRRDSDYAAGVDDAMEDIGEDW